MSARADRKPPPRTSSVDSARERLEDQCYVRNSSFLSRDIEAQKSKTEVIFTATKTTKPESPPVKDVTSPPKKEMPPPPKRGISSPPKKEILSPPKNDIAPPPKKEVPSPPKREIIPSLKNDVVPPLKKDVSSPPVSTLKLNRSESKNEENAPKIVKKEPSVLKEMPGKTEKLSLVAGNEVEANKMYVKNNDVKTYSSDIAEAVDIGSEKSTKHDESNGVGDKIKKFEKAAEDASANSGRLSRPGSVRGRSRTDRLASDAKEDLAPPATPFKDNVHFELGPISGPESHQTHLNNSTAVERQQSLTKNNSPNLAVHKWQKNEHFEAEKAIKKPEPQKIIKPEFKPMPTPVDVTIRSPSLGAKIADQFPSHGTAFRNVASPDTTRSNRDVHKFNDDVNTQNNFKTCKFKTKEKYSVSKGSSYFTRGSEEIWLVKKKDIEEIEERVFDSFRRAGGNICMRSESMRPSSDSGQSVSFTHATMGRNKRQMYARSESLDPQWAGNRAQTLKRQTSVACTCGHDKKTRAKSAGADAIPRPRSRSHGDENPGHVLDKYETLV